MLELKNLTVESLENPLCLDTPQPAFCWQLASDRRDVLQAAYCLQVGVEASFEKPLWDSGRVDSAQSLYIPYAGPPLASRTRYYCRAKAWDDRGEGSAWSRVGRFEMGLLSPAEWQAEWITHPFAEQRKSFKPAYHFRRVFRVEKAVKRARLYASALGLYDVHLNGARLGDELFTPGLTEYRRHIQYQAYALEPQVGENVLGVTLAEGWYRGRFEMNKRNLWGRTGAVLLQMHLEYLDGSEEVLATGGAGWKVSSGAILRADIYDGEDYDARLETGWALPGFDDRLWAGARLYRPPHLNLVAPLGVPVRRIETLPARKVFQTPQGDSVVDFGQNMVGWVRLEVEAEAGRQVVIDFAEVLDREGNFFNRNYRTARSQITYTCRGGGREVYEPHFTFFGFRYARLRNHPQVELSTLSGVVIHSDLRPVGHFSCSNPLLNRLQENIRWGAKGNFLDIPSDCPQRDERLGWTGDAQVFARTAAFNLDVERFFRKWLADLAVSHAFTGAVPFWIPGTLRLPVASSGWGDAATVVPWAHYLVYGDARLLRAQYASMKSWLGYERLAAAWPKLSDLLHPRRYFRRERWIWDTGFHFGDWLAPGERRPEWMAKKAWIATAYFAHSAHLCALAAEVLGEAADARRFRGLFERVRTAFAARFLLADGSLRDGFQTACVLALEFDLLPAAARPVVLAQLVADLRGRGDHLATGFLGTPGLLFALSDNGEAAAAYRLLLQESCPAWLYPVKLGATTIWERWDAIQPDGSLNLDQVGKDNMVSFNHYAFGAVGDWLYRRLAGLELDPARPAYKHCILRPLPGGGLSHAEARFDSHYGTHSVRWEIRLGRMRLEASLPANTTATIRLPRARPGEVRLTGEARPQESPPGEAVFEAGSGKHTFEWEWSE